MGSKPKFWFRYRDELWLYKQARPNTGEHWAEKIASEVADELSLPTHRVELATYEGRPGCAVRSFLEKGQTLIHGNELMAGAIDGYDKEKEQGQSDHNFANIVSALEHRFSMPEVRKRVAFRFVGYLVLDALVGNTDRHHENWGVVLSYFHENDTDRRIFRSGMRIGLAPTFDHGSSLGREMLDERRKAILKQSGGLQRYINKGTGGIFRRAGDRKGLSPIALIRLVAEEYPTLFTPWQKRIAELEDGFAIPLLEKIPEACMSGWSREFVLAFLKESRSLILEI